MGNWKKILYILYQWNTIYHFIFFVASVLAIGYNYLYAFLMLDLIKRSQDLKNILTSVTMNTRRLLFTLILMVIAVFIFAVVAFVVLDRYYETEVTADQNENLNAEFIGYADTLWDTFFSTGILGIRSGGGIGEAIGRPEKTDDVYGERVLFDLLFFIVIVLILLNIVFGIIIDTFAELRDINKQKQNEINNF
jgi:hypothetical protein